MVKSTDQTDRTGIHAVASIFTKLGWAFREQPTSDFGIDAQAEKLNPGGSAGGRLIALQIKSGKSYFKVRGGDFVFYGEDRHRDYWTNHSLPVFIILHNPDDGMTLWQRVDRHLIEETSEGRWAITIPASQTLDAGNMSYIEKGIASDLPSMRRARMALDIPLMREFEKHGEAFVRIEDWVNKGLNFRGAEITFSGDPEGAADLDLPYAMPGYTIEYLMAVWMPWLEYEECEYVNADHGSGEVAVHILSARLSEAGRAMLTLEDFYVADLPPFRPERTERVYQTSDWLDYDPD